MHRCSAIKSKLLGIALAGVLALVFSGVVAPLRAQAPESHPPIPAASGAKPAAVQESKEAKEIDEAADPNEALKHSSPVRWIARKTGLSIDQAYWACVILNFAIVFFALWVPLRKRLPGIFKSRTENIQKRLEEARKTSEEARRRLAEVEGRLSRLDVEITEMRREADENARAEEKRILAEAEQEKRRIVAAAEQEIATAANAARRDLQAYAAELAVNLAEKRIRVGQDADQVLVREFTSELGKDGH